MKKIAIFMALTFVLCIMSPVAASAASSPLIPPNGLDEKVLARHAINKDTIGWLYVPGTKINDVVLKGADNSYYWRRNFDKKEAEDGCFMADYRVVSVPGKLPRNTVIYGHSNDDNPNGDNFSQLKKYLDDDFAKKHPYIYYSDGVNTYTFKIFAVYNVNTLDPDMLYNSPDIDETKMQHVLSVADRLSVRKYQVPKGPEWKLLTLSTNVYDVGDTGFPVEYYRFVIMAKAIINPNV